MIRSTFPAVLIPLLFTLACAEAEGQPPRHWAVDDGRVSLGQSTPARFELAEVTTGEPLPAPKVTGRVQAVELLTSPSYPPLAGRVEATRVRIGDQVAEGDPLVQVRTTDLPALEGELASARLQVQTKAATVEKLERMVEAKLTAEHDLIIARAELDEARLSARTARAQLRSLSVARSGDSSFWILAQRSGTVVQLDATLGQQVGPSQALPVATIADLDEVLVIADVPQREAARLQVGAQAWVTTPGSIHAPVAGEVELVSALVDPDRQTVPVRVRVANNERALRPNAYVDVAFTAVDQDPVVRVPAGAVVRDGPQTIVFVDVGTRSFEIRKVEVGRRSKNEVEVIRGLASGENIVTTNALLLLNAVDLDA
ncbi:efflux RND transporter periplasmic adaptor subunit [Enhygromyxa salina]|uniref:Cobalt-zinc-cadmium resistance protein CzcB n=1 Tax=Enhygromyxa salina TaxID=215803 RepID=A0A2S9XPN6_9BACT|nr:efflux RND transporter periplasmic adaptor subunit [Enhygromyxa salina]PRP94828.1 Cobalt-zinc-cadmium resistance protein CzcB [Enhygromyxa salina]